MKKILLMTALAITVGMGAMAQTPGIEWQKSLGGNSNNDYAHSIQQTIDGGYIIACGQFDDILKTDNAGAIEWQISLGQEYGAWGARPYSIQQTTDGGYVFAGSWTGLISTSTPHENYWVVKFDNAGAMEWQKSLGGYWYDIAYSIQQTTNGGYIVAGASFSNDGDVTDHNGGSDAYNTWIVKLGECSDSTMLSLSAIPLGLVNIGDTVTFTVTTVNGGDNPQYQWRRNGAPVSGAPTAAVWQAVAGEDFESDDIITARLTSFVPCSGLELSNGITMQINPTDIREMTAGSSFTLYPNPNKGIFTLEGTAEPGNYTVMISNVLGQEVYVQTAKASGNKLHIEIAAGDVTPGIYFLNIAKEGKRVAVKQFVAY